MNRSRERRGRAAEAGFTLVEVSIIVMVLSILSAILLPQMGVYLRDARLARAREDVGAIGVAIMQMLRDTGESQFYIDPMGNWRSPDRPGHDGENVVGLLIGDGDVPDEGRLEDSWNWRQPYGDAVTNSDADFGNARVVAGLVDTFANHLIQNYPASGSSDTTGPDWDRYRTPSDMAHGEHSSGVRGGLHFDPVGGEGFNSEFAWRGPYLDVVRADPWGNRYMANVLWFTNPQNWDSAGFNRPVIVLSAGPDEQVDTPFSSVGGFFLGDDDIAFPVSYGTLR